MTISKIWVLAQSADGAATSATLELLTKARAVASDVTAFVVGDAGDTFPVSQSPRRCTR